MLKKKLKLYYRLFIQRIFILIYGKIKIENINSLHEIRIKKIEDLKSDKQPHIKYLLYEIKNGRIYTDGNETVAILNKNNLISNISFQQINGELKDIKFNKVLETGTPKIKKRIDGKVFNLAQGGSGNNYFHFMYDLIPKIYLLEKVLSISSIDYFYVPKIKIWQKKIYSLFGINEKRLIDSEKFKHIESNLIISVNHPWYHQGYIQDEVKNIPDWIINSNRIKFLPLLKKFDNNKKIFLDRSSSVYSHCQIQNNNELIDALTKKGFTSYKVEELNIEEQIHLFNDADIIVGAHGAAFANIMFCKPKTKIIEIIPISHPNRKCERISEILNLKYFRIITEDTRSDKNFPFNILLNKNNLNKIFSAIDLY
jgi:capsular polysaccharide biosynthesis protein